MGPVMLPVVTGGASAVKGLAMARAFLAEGMTLAIADVEQEAITGVLADLGGADAVLGVHTDVTDLGFGRAPWPARRLIISELVTSSATMRASAPLHPSWRVGHQRLALGPRGQRDGSRSRHPSLCSPHDRIGRAWFRCEHLLRRRRHRSVANSVGL